MSTQAQLSHLPSIKTPSNRKQIRKAVLDTGKELVSFAEIPHAVHLVHKCTDVVQTKIVTLGVNGAKVTSKLGWAKFAGFCLKVVAAAPLIAKIVVGVAVGALALGIYKMISAS